MVAIFVLSTTKQQYNMIPFENLINNVLVSYDRDAINAYLVKRGENPDRFNTVANQVYTFFEEDDLLLALIDNENSENSMILAVQDFYVREDALIAIQEMLQSKTENQSVVDLYKKAKHAIENVIVMIPTFQDYYYKHNLRYTSKAFEPEQFESKYSYEEAA